MRHASFRKELVSFLLTCIFGVVSHELNNHLCMGLWITPQHSTDQFNLAQRFLLPASSVRGDTSCRDHLRGTEWCARCSGSVVCSSALALSLCGQSKRLRQSRCGCWGSVGGSEPERPSGVSSLTTGRTPEPLNRGLHFVRSAAPWDSSEGGFNSPGVLVGPSPQPELSCAWRLHQLSPPPASFITINTVQRGCLCVPASSGVYCSLTHSCWAHSQSLAANKHSLSHTCRHAYGNKITCSHKHRCR